MRQQTKNKITTGGNIPRPGQPFPTTIILTQAKRFGIDISDYTQSVRAAENIDFPRRYKLFDLYVDLLMDAHLSSVIDKRTSAVLTSQIEFRRNGKPDETVNRQIRAPWFRRFLRDVIEAQFWGFSIVQFFKKDGWINYDLIDRKHADPVRRIILHRQTDITGTSWDEYADLLFVGDTKTLGLLAKVAPWVIYKRNTTADWAQFSEVFGMPIREYIYETDDDESRRRALQDAQNQGALGILIHSAESQMKLIEAGNKTGSADVYERLCNICNAEISKCFLGNTLTTEATNKGTQALGIVHKEVQDEIATTDRLYALDVLNYDMTDIFLSLGVNTEGGEFCFVDRLDIGKTAQHVNMLATLKNTFDLPVSDDYLYKISGVEKPENYNELKAQALPTPEPTPGPTPEPEPTPSPAPVTEPVQKKKKKEKKNFANQLKSFFGQAPRDGAVLDW
jgi:hypothetical protein